MREGIDRLLGRLLVVAAMLAAATLVAGYGFYLPERHANLVIDIDLGIIAFFVAQAFVRLGLARPRIQYLRAHWMDFALIALLVLQIASLRALSQWPELEAFLARLNIISLTKAYIVAGQIYIGAVVLWKTLEFNKVIGSLRLSPPQTVVISFALVIAVGTLLLMLPRVTASGKPMPLIDALFTASSATCVTGLVVVDTGAYFTRFGQLIVLALIQIGGLGLMSLFAFSATLIGRGIGMKQRAVMKDVLSSDFVGEVTRLLRNIVLITVVCEVAGVVVLSAMWVRDFSSPITGVYFSVFHSVSAFCNAGFSLFNDNLEGFRGRADVVAAVAALIVIGGLGFTVIGNVLSNLKARLKGQRMASRLTVHSRVVLLTTAGLIVFGALAFFVLESPRSMSQYTLTERVLSSLFVPITARTAGFNIMPMGSIAVSSALIVVFLMFVGASPGSTGGGIKTSTFAVLIATMRSILRGRPAVEMFRRTLSQGTVNRAMAVTMLCLGLVFLSTLVVSLVQGQRLVELLFETVSAFGTVGLSMGATPYLTNVGKMTIIITLFLGRIGPLTLGLAMQQRVGEASYSYPSERVMIG